MGVVAREGEVVMAEREDVLGVGVDRHRGKRTRRAGQLEIGLFQVVQVEVGVAEGVDEVAGLQIRHLGHHHGEERIAGDIERHAEEDIGGALVELTGTGSGKVPAPSVECLQDSRPRRSCGGCRDWF